MGRRSKIEALHQRRQLLLETIGQAADEIKMIDEQLKRYTETAKMIEEERSIRSDDHRFDGQDPDEQEERA